MRKRDLKPDETALWGHVARTVKAYPGRHIPVLPAAKTSPAAIAASPKAAPSPASPKKRVVVLPPPADASRHKRVRRGALSIDGRIDLHGMTQEAAKASLLDFLSAVRANHGRCALVITGKGRPDEPIDDYYAPPPGVLRRRLPEWLAEPALRPLIAGWSPAHPKHGGGGAFYVMLKRKPSS